jgi:hypothetical protein
MSEFIPNVAMLPRAQHVLWPSLHEIPHGFVLYGGTALALRLGHRTSFDFDFFSSRPVVPDALLSSVPFLKDGTVAQRSESVLTVWVNSTPGERPVKVSFFGDVGLPVLERPDRPDSNGIVVASLRDLAGTKAKVINQRVELKDYEDIAALLDAGMTLSEIVASAIAIFPGQVDYATTVSAITYFEDGEAKLFPGSLKKKLRSAAMGASPVRAPQPLYRSIEASAAAVGR